ncbi:hypothetical protein LMG24238_07649 [Paraburkholderia sediminicola]|uniref:Oxidoreductase FAD/NAD(P)-binding domain-containing protein n=1 Tax=Paraburkholderia sediminicola TaxID=458836 RepID=A0A6J5CYQ0_9BURK|nr:hypothetical protein LMG24238_07649 [Paraburkholderia sediminicola]
MVAGGTGLSAFLGMLDDLAHKGSCGQPVRLYYGVTNFRDLCVLDRLKEYASQYVEKTLTGRRCGVSRW